jgi:hypothetical protein
MKTQILCVFAVVTLTIVPRFAWAQDHGHLNVGAVGTNQNDQLIFDNGAIFVTSSDYVKTLDYASTGTYSGHYAGNITFTALAATTNHLGPVSNAPALGSWIFAQLVSVDGPPGGVFSFWNIGSTSPTISLLSGTTGTNVWQLSENDGSPGSDPYGHFHGRRFTATKPGIYTVGFRAFDLSANGVGGGPIHSPSSVMKVYFQAGVQMKDIKPEAAQTQVTFGARAGWVWQVEAVDSPFGETNWQSIGSPIIGDDYFRQVQDHRAITGQRYYRVSGTIYIP